MCCRHRTTSCALSASRNRSARCARRSPSTALPPRKPRSLSRGETMAGRNFLFVPGPTNVPDRVLRSMVVAMEDHRSSKFPELTRALFADLKRVFQSQDGEVFIFPSTGTGAWEAALANTLSPGDHVLAARYGQFSHLWIDMMQRLGLEVQVIDVEWGEGAPEARIGEILGADRAQRIKGVMIVHNETATGVTSDIAAVRRAMDAAQHPALLYVDAVSSLGSLDFRMSEWQVDLAVTGSQKGPDAARRTRHRLREPARARRGDVGEMQARILRLRRHAAHEPGRVFSLHAAAAAALRASHLARHTL